MVDHSYHNNHGQERGRRKNKNKTARKLGKIDQRQAGRLPGKKEKRKLPRRRRGKEESELI
jgi:hypothetical protein